MTKNKHASHSAWQAQYLGRLDRDTCCSAHCHENQAYESFWAAGAVFGEVGGLHHVTSLAPRIVNDASYDEDQACEAFCVAGAIFGEVGG